MSIIQDIREKYAKLTVVLIALALVGFILTDYFSGQGRGGGGAGSKNIGSVNGTSIGTNEFNRMVEQAEINMRQQGGSVEQAREQVWNQKVEDILLQDEYNKLGISVGTKELKDLLYGPNPSQIAKQYLGSQTGEYDPSEAMRIVSEINKGKDKARKNQLNELLDYIAKDREREKLVSLLANTVNFPRWFMEKQNAESGQMARVSLVKEDYGSIPDSTVKIEDKEIADYISKHKKDFKQEESRSISYVAFSARPSAADSQAIKNQLLLLKPEFDTTKDVAGFLAREGGLNFYDSYISGNTIQIPVKDSIFKIPVGSTYGPYVDGGTFVLAKLVGVKQIPDTVKVRHILIGTSQRDPQTGQTVPTRDTVTAFKLADSIKTAIAKGSNFDSLCKKFSDDPGSKDSGGVYKNVYSGQMVPPFNDFIFQNPTGSKGIVKTDFGYHYIEILTQKGTDNAYKIAQLSREISASPETDQNAQNDALKFAGDSRDQKSFDATFDKEWGPKGYKKAIATDIKPNASFVSPIGTSRVFVRNIYDAKRGQVLRPERVGEDYVVAVVTEVFEEGTQSVGVARQKVEPALRNKKKAEMLKKKIGTITTLEAAATALGGKPIEAFDSLRVSSRTTPKLGYEPRVLGAIFNPANKGKVIPEAIEGLNGIYVIRVEDVTTTSVTAGSIADQRKQRADQMKQYISNPGGQFGPNPTYPVTVLKNTATIKDNRAKIF